MSLKKEAPSSVSWLQAIIFFQFSASFFIVVLTTVGLSFDYPVAAFYLMALLQVVVAIPGIVHIALKGNIWVAIYIAFQLVTASCEIYWLIYMIVDNSPAGRWIGLALLAAINVTAVVIALWFRNKTLKMPSGLKKKKEESEEKEKKPEMKTPSTSMAETDGSKKSSKESSARSSKREAYSNKSSSTSSPKKSESSTKTSSKSLRRRMAEEKGSSTTHSPPTSAKSPMTND